MRILIIEDKANHILSAEKFANECGHDVTIVNSYDAAEKALYGECKYSHSSPITEPEKFEVVLTDMFLPASLEGIGDGGKRAEFEKTEQPYGLSLILLAMRQGTKAIGLLTDGDHHGHPITWALDTLGGYDGKPFTVGDVTLLCCSNGPKFSQKYHWEKEDKPHHVPAGDPLEGAKDWMEFWLMLLNSRSPLQPL